MQLLLLPGPWFSMNLCHFNSIGNPAEEIRCLISAMGDAMLVWRQLYFESGPSWFFSHPSRLLHWHWGNCIIAPVPAKHPWNKWINLINSHLKLQISQWKAVCFKLISILIFKFSKWQALVQFILPKYLFSTVASTTKQYRILRILTVCVLKMRYQHNIVIYWRSSEADNMAIYFEDKLFGTERAAGSWVQRYYEADWPTNICDWVTNYCHSLRKHQVISALKQYIYDISMVLWYIDGFI